MNNNVRSALIGGLAATFVVVAAIAPRFTAEESQSTVRFEQTSEEALPEETTTTTTIVEETTTTTAAPTTTTTQPPTTTTSSTTTTTVPPVPTTLIPPTTEERLGVPEERPACDPSILTHEVKVGNSGRSLAINITVQEYLPYPVMHGYELRIVGVARSTDVEVPFEVVERVQGSYLNTSTNVADVVESAEITSITCTEGGES